MNKVREAAMSEFRIHLVHNDPGVSPDHVWLVHELGEDMGEKRVKDFRIEGFCYGIYAPIAQNRPPYFQLGSRGFAYWEEEPLRIVSLRRQRVKDLDPHRGVEIRVRFNTDRITNPEAPPWRVLEKKGDGYTEHHVATFVISGVCYSTREVLPGVGEKWHVGCRGQLRLFENHADIVSYE